MTRDKYKDLVNLRIALVVSELASCARHKVGSVLVDTNGRILATGRNGTRTGQRHCSELMLSGELRYEDHAAWSKENEVHAEVNAISFCRKYGLETAGTTMYSTHSPRSDCADRIIEAGITRLVYIQRYDDSREIETRLRERGVDVVAIDADINDLRRKLGTSIDLFTTTEVSDGREDGEGEQDL